MELARARPRRRVVYATAAVPRRPELAREPAAGLEPVGVRRDVEHLRPGRVGDGAVVALEEVLDADLPVARVLVRLGPGVESQRVDVDPVRPRACSGSPPRWAASGSASVSGLTNTNGPQASTETGTSPSAVVSNPGSRSARGAFRSDAVEAVRPRVVGALDRLAPRITVAEDGAAVPADVDEAAELAVPGTRQDDRERARAGRRQLPGLGDLVEAGGVLPRAGEDRAPARARSTAGSAYQSYGSVRAPATVAIRPIYRAAGARRSSGPGRVSGRPPRRGGRAPARSASPTRARRPWASPVTETTTEPR